MTVRRGRPLRPWILGIQFLAAAPAVAEGDSFEAAPDKRQYHLFHPTPRALMREMDTDRPDQTESPYTVDAGHLQLEMDFFSFTYDRTAAATARSFSAAAINLKIGLLNNIDAQFVFDSYLREEVQSGGQTVSASGSGDFQTRLKVNLWGDDSGDTALAIMPFVKWPVPAGGLGNGVVEGGVIVPFGINLSERFSLTMMTEVDVLKDSASVGYHPDFVNSITLGSALTEKLGAYVEFFSVTTTESGNNWIGQFDFGFTWSATENIRFDAGVNIGVTSSAPDWQPFIGGTFRY